MKPAGPTTYNFLYKTLCLETGMYYYGIHSTCTLNDGYLGTGKLIRSSVKKYGPEAHERTIIEFFNSREDASEAERRVVTRALLQDPYCMNLQTGGEHCIAFSQASLQRLKKTPQQREAISQRRKGKATLITMEQRKTHSKKVSGEGNGMFGVDRPDEWREGQSNRQRKRYETGQHQFCNQPSYVKGKHWFHNPLTGERGMRFDQPDGWQPGKG